MNVRELVTEAFYLSGKLGADFETMTGQMASRGLKLLNYVLADRNSDGRFLPYYDILDIPAVVGQEEYFVPNLVQLETFTVTRQDVRDPMQWVSRDVYFGSGRVNHINSLPYEYHSDRIIDPDTNVAGTKIWVYWEPSQTDYTFQVNGRFSLGIVTLDTVISNSLELFFIDYLVYKTASRICQFYDLVFGSDRTQTLMNLEERVNDVNPIDTTSRIITAFGGQNPFNWGDVNFGRGWRP